MSFLSKETTAEVNGIKIKCERGKEQQAKEDLQHILDRITYNDLKGLKKLVDNPAKLNMARSFM